MAFTLCHTRCIANPLFPRMEDDPAAEVDLRGKLTTYTECKYIQIPSLKDFHNATSEQNYGANCV